MRFLDPRNDVAFKKIFGSEDHKDITISFLNSILGYTGDQVIVDVQFMNTEQHPMLKEKKENILDIMCTDQKGYKYIVEMQVEQVKEFGKRMVYYGAKTYALQLGGAAPYYKLSPVIVIAIVDFIMFPKKKNYVSIHKILDDVTYENDLQQLTFAFVELKKFKKIESELRTAQDKWIYFIKEISTQDHIPTKLANEEFEEACHLALRGTWNEDELSEYDDAFVRATDAQTSVELAIEKGIAMGMEKGVEKGIQKGLEDTALKMLAEGFPMDIVVRVTGLSIDQIKALQKK
jgi:predicted transposase/invertase (TIGR01784 family)